MSTTSTKEEKGWEREFDEKFKCIHSDCDGTGCIPNQIADDEWEAQQCQFHAEYLHPLKAFIRDLLVTHGEKERQKGRDDILKGL